MPRSVASSDDGSVGRVQACCNSAKQKWSDFLIFLWNPTDKTVLGRGGKSWGRILIFYLFYYAFLAALFAISITIVLNSLDPYKPFFQTRLQTPGVTIEPRQSSYKALTSDIKYSVGGTNGNGYSSYVKRIDEMLWRYSLVNQSDPKVYKNCTNGKVAINQKFTADEAALSCVFNKDVFGPCASPPYGYDTGKPCIFVKLNRIINWFPVSYTDISGVAGNDASKAPPLVDVLKTNNAKYEPYKVYVSCYGMKPEDQKNLNGVQQQVSDQTVYFPRDASIPFMYFPYYGNKRQPEYRSPFVAVQFKNITRGTLIKMGCKAYARNIEDDMRMRVGYFNFEMEIKD